MNKTVNVKVLKNYKILFLALLFLSGFLVRLYRFDSPIADWHSWRQADTSSVSRNFVKGGFDLLHPKFDDLSNVPSKLDNPMGFRFVEFPIYNIFQAATFKYVGIFTLEQWGRLVTISASLLSALFLYLIIKKRYEEKVAFLSAFFFLFLPFNIYYSRVILPDPSLVTAVLGGTYFFQKWIEKSKLSIFNYQFSIALIFTISAFLLKPYAIFFTLPMVYLAFEKFGFSFLKKWQLWTFLILSLIPLALWRFWMLNFPEGIPSSSWLFNGNGIRFRPSFFRWIFYERLTRLMLGYFGLIFIVFPFIKTKINNNFIFMMSFLMSSLIYISVIATGNVQHDYYQILVIPTIAILLGIGSVRFIDIFEKQKKYLGFTLFVIVTASSFYFAWGQIKDYFNINNWSIVAAGKAVDKYTPINAKVIANYNGDTSFLYQTNRKGWASFEKPIPEMINKLGADFLVLANPTEVDLGLGKTYKIVAKTNQYVIFNLRQKP